MLPFEVLLPLGAVGFYVYDSLLLLFGNEMLFVRTRQGWRVVEASRQRLLGRRLCLLNLVLPHWPVFRVAVSERQILAVRGTVPDQGPFLLALRGPGACAALLLVLIAVVLPFVSIGLGAGPVLLAVFAACYGVAAIAASIIFMRRDVLALSGRAFTGVALDALLCPPFGVNIVRKLSLRRELGCSPLDFARAHFDATTLSEFRGILTRMLRDADADSILPVEAASSRSRCLAVLEDPSTWR